MNEGSTVAKIGAYFARATRLHCPVCGRTPIFPRVLSIRRLVDWWMPLDGCPRCGYAFEREPGYFLTAVWAVNASFASLLGLVVCLVVEWLFQPPLSVTIGAVVAAIGFFNVLFVRHAKAYFIAVDHLLDPHERGGGDDRGNQRLRRPPRAPAPGADGPCAGGPRVR